MNNRRNIFIILFAFIFLISDTLTQSCGTPAECFSYAIGILERDRTEMRRQLDKYEELHTSSLQKISQLEKIIEGKIIFET